MNRVFMLEAAGRPGSARSPDGLLPLLRIGGHVGLRLFSGPLQLLLGDLWRGQTEDSGLLSKCVWSTQTQVNLLPLRPESPCCPDFGRI